MNHNHKMSDKFFSQIAGTLLAILAIILFIITFTEVFCRYILNTSLFWVEEVARYLGIWIAFIGISVGIRQNVHVSLDFVVSKIAKKFLKKVVIVRNALTSIFFIYLTYLGLKFVKIGMDRLTLNLKIPIGYIYLAIPIGSLLAILALVWETVPFFTKRKDNSE